MLENIITQLCTQPLWVKCLVILLNISIILTILFYNVNNWQKIWKVIGCILAFPTIYICSTIAFHTAISIFCSTKDVLAIYHDFTSFWTYLYDTTKNAFHQIKFIWNDTSNAF